MVGDLTRARLRADEARCELSRVIWEAGRPGADPEDVLRALKASILRAIGSLEEADPLLASGTLEAAGQYGRLRDLEVQLAFERGGTAAADALIDGRYAPRTDAMPPNDEPDDSDLREMAREAAIEDAIAGTISVTPIDGAHAATDGFADDMLALVDFTAVATAEGEPA